MYSKKLLINFLVGWAKFETSDNPNKILVSQKYCDHKKHLKIASAEILYWSLLPPKNFFERPGLRLFCCAAKMW